MIFKIKTENNSIAYSQGWRYVVWVGGCDDYYVDYKTAKEHYDEWIEQGYDGVHLMKLVEEIA
tara:strand:+ start:410 stop:598 length:189 start_codon:yes stop_codon:yes gene_type:complete